MGIVWRSDYCHRVFNRQYCSNDNHNRNPVRHTNTQIGDIGYMAFRQNNKSPCQGIRMPVYYHEFYMVNNSRDSHRIDPYCIRPTVLYNNNRNTIWKPTP